MNEAEVKGEELEKAFNELIAKCAEHRGHIYIIDNLRNNFILRITEPIRIHVYEGYKGNQDEDKGY